MGSSYIAHRSQSIIKIQLKGLLVPLSKESQTRMPAIFTPNRNVSCPQSLPSSNYQTALLRGEVLLETKAHTAWGAAVMAQMYVPRPRPHVWQQLTDYPRWQQYFIDITQSHLLSTENPHPADAVIEKRLYQAASKSFLFLHIQVKAYLRVVETLERRIQFRLESGSFQDFAADLRLRTHGEGTLLTYYVQATPLIPIPSMVIQQAIHLDLPANMRKMRQVICA
ncbi:MAG: SRPBCC family protein [Leptolyngbyaceae cyanobacterium bins.302]|nr:SRPBCC family protein [Leptolyngbyaceae cyanobacterium bins.302]